MIGYPLSSPRHHLVCCSMALPLAPFCAAEGCDRGTPLSPLLFVMAIDPLNHILELTTAQGLLSNLRWRTPMIRTSHYADDAAIFMVPVMDDISNLAAILHCFGVVTSLVTNCQKSMVVPIGCNGINLDEMLLDFLCGILDSRSPQDALSIVIYSTWRIRWWPSSSFGVGSTFP